jgi:hypothetical protein
MKLDERTKGFLVLLLDANNPQSVFLSVDARLSGDYSDYDKAVESARNVLTGITSQAMPYGVKISGKIGPGMGSGLPVTMAIFRHGGAAVNFETNVSSDADLQLFQSILSTVAIKQ